MPAFCNMNRPPIKRFGGTRYAGVLKRLDPRMPTLEFERITEAVARDILADYEGFTGLEKGPDFQGTPFDFFGYRNGLPHIIEYKGSLVSFRVSGYTQKRRMMEVRKHVRGLHIALLQVRFRYARYRIFYDRELDALFSDRKADLERIIAWLKPWVIAEGR